MKNILSLPKAQITTRNVLLQCVCSQTGFHSVDSNVFYFHVKYLVCTMTQLAAVCVVSVATQNIYTMRAPPSFFMRWKESENWIFFSSDSLLSLVDI